MDHAHQYVPTLARESTYYDSTTGSDVKVPLEKFHNILIGKDAIVELCIHVPEILHPVGKVSPLNYEISVSFRIPSRLPKNVTFKIFLHRYWEGK